MKWNKGFTLLEVMLVLTFITSFLFLVPNVKNSSCQIKMNHFMKILDNNIQYGVSYTLSHFTLVNLYIIPHTNTIVIYDGRLIPIRKEYYDQGLIIFETRIYISHGYVIYPLIITVT
ncbi:MAG TPA: prepilin-type N-terminal cleavage/methylation domain-containing protein, partial [Haloplasmataceae bacterium]